MEKRIYRARGFYKPTGRKSWLTTVWRRSRTEAISDISAFGRNYINTKIVSFNQSEWERENQRIPRF